VSNHGHCDLADDDTGGNVDDAGNEHRARGRHRQDRLLRRLLWRRSSAWASRRSCGECSATWSARRSTSSSRSPTWNQPV